VRFLLRFNATLTGAHTHRH